jgi:hypothetical protein
METLVTLGQSQEFTVRLAARSKPEIGLMQVAWVFVKGESGTASLLVTDNDGTISGPWDVPTPGVAGSVVRGSSNPPESVISVRAGEEGFRGAIFIELLGLR